MEERIIFTDLKISKESCIGITGLVGNITKKETSHKGAWARIIKSQLEDLGYSVHILEKNDDLKDYKHIIIDMGMEYKGTLNLFGGASDKLADRLKSIVDYKNKGGSLYTIEGQFPDINALIKERFNSATERFRKLMLFAGDWNRLHEETPHIDLIYKSEKVIVGDSHVLSMWREGYEIHRYDGKTLYGMLEQGLSEFVPLNTKELILYFGNIDIRHHLMRTKLPLMEVRSLIEEYINQITTLTAYRRDITSITIVAPLPIEDESRKLPKTGYYKGTPFYGSWEERNRLRDIMLNLLYQHALDHDLKIISWPDHYKENDQLSFDVMEKPKSVHISPTHYFWDLNENKMNYKFYHDTNQGGLFNE